MSGKWQEIWLTDMWEKFLKKSELIFDKPLADLSTLRVGGKAEAWFVAKDSADLIAALAFCNEHNIPVSVLGGGSNVLINDGRIPGLVISNKANSFEVLAEQVITTPPINQARWVSLAEPSVTDYDESKYPLVAVRADSGCLLSWLMVELLKKKVTGLEWFAGIPGSVGGAIYMNMHGGPKLFGDLLVTARLFDHGQIKHVNNEYFKWRYDWSILHDTKEVVIDAVLALRCGPVDQAKNLMVEWMKHKNKSQDKKSTGCIFQNLTSAEQARLNIPSPGAGYVIDKLLDLNGHQIGGAKISETHGNFMVNAGNARAEDFAILIAYIKEQARNKLNLELHEEIEYIGFGQ
jgi:UDP-N-acetylmuramate dehydrogenase